MQRWAILVLAFGALGGCDGDATEREAGAGEWAAAGPVAAATETTPAAGAEGAGVVYVDVRTPKEFAAGHVEGAIHIPHTEMTRRWRELEEFRDRPIVVYCRSGRRSGIALEVLREQGFSQAVNGGGLSELEREGVPISR